MGYTTVTPEDIASMEGLDDWAPHGTTIEATYRAASFAAAAELIQAIVGAADDYDHHPDIDLRYPGLVRVVFTTHATGGLTMHDVEMARRTSALASARGASREL